MPKRVGKYEIGRTLGEGTFGKVKYATNTETNEAVAIKVLDKEKIQKQNMGAQIKKEISIMKMIRHAHVVALKEVLASRTKIFIVLELVLGGELFDKIVSEGRFAEQQARYYFRQLVNGVEYCHAQGVCHRDLKPENLLLDENANLKISDFGLSALYSGGGEQSSRSALLHTTCGTPNYVAPEVLADKGYDGRTADVWSCGVILYVLLAGFLPFDEPTMSALFRKIQSADFSYPSWFSSEVRALLDTILVADPSQRVTLQQVKDSAWFVAGDNDVFRPTPVLTPITATSGPTFQPTTLDIEAAVQSTEVTEGGGESKRDDGPKRINAFDLINMCGGMALNRMFQSTAERQVKRVFQFTSNLPAPEILDGIRVALEEMGCEIRIFESTFKIKASLITPKGMIGVIVQIYVMADSLHLVEVRRGKGDILEYYNFYNTLVTEKIGHLINQVDGADNGGK